VSSVHPTVRYLIVCEDVKIDPQKPRPVSLIGLISALQSDQQPAFLYVHKELCVFVQLTECRGPGQGRIEIQHADSGDVAVRGRTQTLALSSDPLRQVGCAFRLRNCRFPEAGLYWFQFWYNGRLLEQQPVW
jgi:hypothetical protein